MKNLDSFTPEMTVNSGEVEVAQVDVKVKRLTANIGVNLPFALFGRQFLASGYSPIIQVPSGLTLDVTTGMTTPTPADYGKVIFTYDDGVATDAIEVTASAGSPYPALIEATLSDIFSLNRMRVSLSDASLQDQFTTALEINTKSLFGKQSSNAISQSAFKTPGQFQDGIIDITISAGLDKETAIVGEIIPAVGFTVTFSLFIARLKKLNKNLI